MDPLTIFMTWQFILFSLGIGGFVFVIRALVETFFPKIVKTYWWSNFILLILPIMTGVITGYIAVSYPYPLGIIASSSRLIFGAVAGMFSGLTYRIIKSLLVAKIAPLIDSITSADLPAVDGVGNKQP